MKCDGVRLDAYFDDELPAAEAEAVERHLPRCENCREALAEMASLREAFRRPDEGTLSQVGLARAHQLADDFANRRLSPADATVARLAWQLVGLAASILIIASAWLMTAGDQATPRTEHPRPIAVGVGKEPEWERVAMTLQVDPYGVDPATGGDPQQVLADASSRDAQLADWVVRGLTR